GPPEPLPHVRAVNPARAHLLNRPRREKWSMRCATAPGSWRGCHLRRFPAEGAPRARLFCQGRDHMHCGNCVAPATGLPYRKESMGDAELLITIAHILTTEADLTEALRRVVREVVRFVGAETGAAYRVDREQRVLAPVAAYRVPKHTLPVLTSAV